MKYLCLIYTEEMRVAAAPREAIAAVERECLAYERDLQRSGHLLAVEALEPTCTAATLRVRTGGVSVTDGPFAETKEQLAGFYLLEARDLNDAIRMASRIPPARLGSVEVRPIRDLTAEPPSPFTAQQEHAPMSMPLDQAAGPAPDSPSPQGTVAPPPSGAAARTVTETLVEELTREGEATRRLLERIPEERLDWAPHPRSMTLGQLALHVAAIPSGVTELLALPAAELPDVPLPPAESRAQILSVLDESLTEAAGRIRAWGDRYLHETWRLTADGTQVLEAAREFMVRSIVLNHTYHHRGQLTIYLRMLDVPLPQLYGPTADEPW